MGAIKKLKGISAPLNVPRNTRRRRRRRRRNRGTNTRNVIVSEAIQSGLEELPSSSTNNIRNPSNQDSNETDLSSTMINSRLTRSESTKHLVLHLLGDRKTNENEPPSHYEEEANLLQDLDLAILGSSPVDYKTYTELLRREYNSLSDESYKVMRLKVLETLLMIPNIFLTKEFQDKYEQAARENIRQEIDLLKAAH